MSFNPPGMLFWGGITLIAFHFFGALGAGVAMIVGAMVTAAVNEVDNGRRYT